MSMLAHRNPTNHPTDWWDQVILAIPKGADLHSEQLSFLKGMDCEPIDRILDIGSGEGTFTETALTLLFQAGRLAPAVHIDIVEGADELWKACELRLCSLANHLKVQGLSLTFSRIITPHVIPRNTDELIAAFDAMQRRLGAYPLIIASHVTYYFHDGGIDFAYALLTRMLAYGGYAWFVVRDRNCPFYRLRKKLLVANGVPDINAHQFSDSFINGLKVLFNGVSSTRRELFLDLEGKTKKQARKVVEYLTWLNGLDDYDLDLYLFKQVNETGLEYNPNLQFAEQHVWLRNNGDNITDNDEKNRLQAVHTLSRCINSIIEVTPDTTFLSVSLAEIAPQLGHDGYKPSGADIDYIQEDHSKPMAFPGFNLIRYGFDGLPVRVADNNLLEQYFHEHTSFLYYPRFYIDHISVCPETCCEAYFHTVMPSGTGRSDDFTFYTCRSGDFENFPINKNILVNSKFGNAIEAWARLTENYYITEETQEGLWTFAVGTHLLPGGAFIFKDDPHLNSRCALFVTVASGADFGRLSSYAVGHIKTILTQYLAQKIYQTALERLRQAEKAEQIMHLLQRPLDDLSNALDSMQRDTQELKSILYEPSEALFRGYTRIRHLFEQGKKIDISNQLQITIQHTASNYHNTEILRVYLCHLICRCCGRDNELANATTPASYSEQTVGMLAIMEEQPAFSSIIRGIKFLCGVEQISELLTAGRDHLISMVSAFKAALFNPFKLDSRTFSGIALALLFEAHPVAVRAIRDHDLPMLPEWTPLRYSTVLSFLSKLYFEYQHRTRSNDGLELLQFTRHPLGGGILLRMKGRPMFDRRIGNAELVRQRINKVLTFPRDWRLDHATAGDFMSPFIVLASSLLGIGDEWLAIKTSGNELLKLQSSNGLRYFCLQIADDQLRNRTELNLIWCPVGEKPV